MKKHPLIFKHLKIALAAITTLGSVVGCAPTLRTYKVTFKDGSVEYYQLNYKPKKSDTSINYEGETIIGVTKIEKF